MIALKKFLIYWLPVILWTGLIYFLSSFHKLQASTVDWQDFVFRKTAHFSEYAILFVLLNRGLNHTTKMSVNKRLIWSLILTVGYAISDEFHQTMVTGRTGRPFDIGIDSLGAIAGLVFMLKFANFLPKRMKEIVL